MQKIVLIVLIAMSISGCSVLKHGKKTPAETESNREISVNSIIEKNLTRNNFDIQKAEIQYTDNSKTVNLLASLKYRTSEEYMISMRSRTGIEIARIFVTNDTILLNDRINRKLYYGSSDYLEKKYGISAKAIPILFGDIIIADNHKAIIECKDGKGEVNEKLNSKILKYQVDCDKKKISGLLILSDKEEGLIEGKLDDFQYIEDKLFPGTVKLLEVKGKSEIRINIRKVSFNESESLKFIPGANYEKVLIK